MDATDGLRVVHVITTLTTGGAERQLDWITKHSGHSTSTVALYRGGAIADEMERDGRQVEVLGMQSWRKVLAIPRLALALRRARPDVVHVHLLSGQLWGIPAARLAGVRTVVSTEHSLMETSIENRPLTRRLRWLYLTLERMTTHTVAVSTTTERRLVAWGVRAKRISVIDNGIDFASLRFSSRARTAIRAELGIPPAATVVGAVGRLEAVKRFPQLLDAVAGGLRPGVRELVIAGDGPLRGELERRAAELGVAPAVHLLGPRSDMRDVLSAMDVLVSPSRDETFGMAVIEGLANGMPVVYAQCPALDELPDVPTWAVELRPSDGSEAAAIGTAVDAALGVRPVDVDGPLPFGRVPFPVPEALIATYGIEPTSRALDSLYARLQRKDLQPMPPLSTANNALGAT